MNPYLFQDRSTSLGPGAGLDARDGPRRGGHSILLCVTKKPRGSRGDLFFHCVMIHRQFLLGFISGASLLLRSWSSDALRKQGIELPCHSLRGAGHDSVVLLIGPGASNESASSWFHCCLSLSLERSIIPGFKGECDQKYLKFINL